MKNRRQTNRRLLGFWMACVMLFSVAFGMHGVQTACATDAAQIAFTVPETIYLLPSGSGCTQFQYYLNVNPNGTVPQGYSTQGSVYFHDPDASNVVITCDDPCVTLSPAQGTTTVAATIGGHLQSAVQQGSVRLLTWTATYSENGQTKQVQTYSVAYAPTERPVGAIAASNAKSGDSVYAACSTVMYGIQSVACSFRPEITLLKKLLESDPNEVYGTSTINGTGTYLLPLSQSGSTPPFYAGGSTPTALMSAIDSVPDLCSQGGTAFGYLPIGESDCDIFVCGGVGRVFYDVSRFTTVGQIPNLMIRSFLNGAGSNGNFDSRADEFSEKAIYFTSGSSIFDPDAAYTPTRYWESSNRTTNTVCVPSPDVSGVALSGSCTTLVNVITRRWRVSFSLVSDKTDATAITACEFYAVDKSSVREAYLREVSYARQCGANTQAWNNYTAKMREAALYLGRPDAQNTVDVNALTAAGMQVQNSATISLTLHPNGGMFTDNGSTGNRSITGTAGQTITLPRELSKTGYRLAGWARPDGSAADDPYTFGMTGEMLIAQWERAGALRLRRSDASGSALLTPCAVVPVTVRLTENPGLIALLLRVQYDEEDLELIRITEHRMFGTDSGTEPIFYPGASLSDMPYAVCWSDDVATQNHTENGDLITYFFRVRNTAAAGQSTISLSYAQSSTFDVQLRDVLLDVGSLTLTIGSRKGDMNGDCAVNAADMVAMRRHMADPAAHPIAGINADMNGDSQTNEADVTLLKKQLVGGYAVTTA